MFSNFYSFFKISLLLRETFRAGAPAETSAGPLAHPARSAKAGGTRHPARARTPLCFPYPFQRGCCPHTPHLLPFLPGFPTPLLLPIYFFSDAIAVELLHGAPSPTKRGAAGVVAAARDAIAMAERDGAEHRRYYDRGPWPASSQARAARAYELEACYYNSRFASMFVFAGTSVLVCYHRLRFLLELTEFCCHLFLLESFCYNRFVV